MNVVSDIGQQRALVADTAIGDEDHLTYLSGVAGQAQCKAQCRQHFSAACGTQITHIADRCLNVIRGRRPAGAKQFVRCAVELYDIERIARCKTSQCQLQGCLGLDDRAPVHRTRGVDHEDRLARQALHFGTVFTGRHHHQQRVGFPLVHVAEKRSSRCITHLGSPLEYEVAVGRHGVADQHHLADLTVDARPDVVRGAFDGQCKAGLDARPDAHWIDRTVTRVGHLRGDSRRIRHLVGVLRPAAAGKGADAGRSRDITRCHHHWKAQCENTVVVA